MTALNEKRFSQKRRGSGREFHSRKPDVEPAIATAAATSWSHQAPSDRSAGRRARGSKVDCVGVFAASWNLGDGRREEPGDCSVIHWSLSNKWDDELLLHLQPNFSHSG